MPVPAPETTSDCGSTSVQMTVRQGSTFERYLTRLDAYRWFRTQLEPGVVASTIRRLDESVAEVDGRGFVATPFETAPDLARAAGLAGVELWVKDETCNVSGSHKARHLFGVALAHQLELATASDSEEPANAAPFAIASCGNAALAAAVVARALEHPLEVFVPTWANETVTDRISGLGGRVRCCERQSGVAGDPAHHAMLAAIADGAIPFSCQGTETPTTIEGGRTLAWEMVDTLAEHDGDVTPRLDRVAVQVGGGALATAVLGGLADSVARTELAGMPVVHAVQPVGNHPLVRAWDTVAAELLDEPLRPSNAGRAASARAIGPLESGVLRAVIRRLAGSPERYMRVWETEPVSYASGILDDITYDWLGIVEAMLVSGGWPIVASEDDFKRAHRLAHQHTHINVCPTGASGLGGLLALQASASESGLGHVSEGERVAVLFTGQMRPGDPDPLMPAS